MSEHIPAAPIVDIRNLRIALPRGHDRTTAVEDVSLSVSAGEIVCVVGESGSGKSVIAQSIMGILPKPLEVASGSIRFEGEELVGASAAKLRALRGSRMGMIFQEPMTALNPVYTVGAQIDEVLKAHTRLGGRERLSKVMAAMEEVNLPEPATLHRAYPHELSGGQRQRILIAAALILQPRLLIADEPTTALDVTTQAQILQQIRRLQAARGMGVLFITHDFGVVAEIADRVVVLRAGNLIETGDVGQVLRAPAHPYTRGLIDAVPALAPPPPRQIDAEVIFRGKGVAKSYGSSQGRSALRPTDLVLRRGETVGLIGESGSGKSTLARCLAGIIAPSSGDIALADDGAGGRRHFKQRVQIVFQDPYRSLNPRRTIGQSLVEGPRNFGEPTTAAWDRARSLMSLIGLDPSALKRYPHQFSGGQRQRICIARALAMDPDVLVADEAVSALDVSVQSQILDLLRSVQKMLNLGILFITHDIRVASQLCDRIMVMHRGEVVETGNTEDVILRPSHDYTRSLFRAIPGTKLLSTGIQQNLGE